MTFGQRRARLAHLVQPIVPARPVGGQASLGLHGMGSFTGRPLRAFQALAEEQNRLGLLNPRHFAPVVPVGPAPVHALAVPGQPEEVSVARYLESLERDRQEREAREGTTAAMLAFAAASDMREAFPGYRDEETVEYGFFASSCPAHDPALAQD